MEWKRFEMNLYSNKTTSIMKYVTRYSNTDLYANFKTEKHEMDILF